MNFKSEDFAALVPPTRRMVYDAFALFFGAVMIPCLRRSMPLGNMVRNNMSTMLLKLLGSPAVMGVRSGVTWASKIVDRVVDKGIAVGRYPRLCVLWEDSRLGLDLNSGRYCLGDALRGTTDSLGGGVIDDDSWQDAISSADKLCSQAWD